ncbi:uncharacterized protein H6S33_007351 [Morchella sextelata]|uniref:uncharacterized protein n=1 Tax=Morchella sextelata TaxID=1174677 RepID=UPI001D049FDF|nr:uncharacterized protein H6S33_007351 [Morchella sextelata]KAH0603692.1 hypothetical protein H6S33_007351 [Morchella sextelata]
MAFTNPKRKAFAADTITRSQTTSNAQVSSPFSFRSIERNQFRRSSALPLIENGPSTISATSPSSFSHRPNPPPSYQQFAQTQSSDPSLHQPESRQQQSQHRPHQQPILDPQTAAAYFKNLTQQHQQLESTLRSYKMQQEQMKAFDPEAAFNELFSPEFSSPQFTAAHDFNTAVPTISPQELLMNQPASAATTHLTSPLSFFDSPNDSYDTSPLFAPDDITQDGAWYSLFPDAAPDTEDSSVSPPNPTLPVQGSPLIGSGYSDDDIVDAVGDSPSTSPRFRSTSAGPNQRRSQTSGVRKRGPLPPIVVEDPSDTVAMKRARNTLAARKSRAKKLERMEEMEIQIEELKAQVEHWKNIATQANRRRS